MRRFLKHSFLKVAGALLLVVGTLSAPQSACAKDPDSEDSATAISPEMDNELHSPAIDKKAKPYVLGWMKTQAENLYRQGYQVETMRDGLVVIATIPTDELFAPNDTVLMTGAAKHLMPFKGFFDPDNLYKIVIAVHSDDTGTEAYCFDLTESRINAVIDFFESLGLDIEIMVGFPCGQLDPRASNMSREGRAANRRLEIYLVPDEGLITLARKKK